MCDEEPVKAGHCSAPRSTETRTPRGVARRHFQLGFRFVGAGCGVLALYVIVTESTGLEPLGPRTPDTPMVAHRVPECLVLWWMYCAACALVSARLGWQPREDTRLWPVVCIPLVMGALHITLELPRWLRPAGPISMLHSSRDWLLLVALPLVLWASGPVVVSATLWYLLARWKRLARAEHCQHCDYNLRGNLSGICPECGVPIGQSKDVNRP